MPTTLSIDTPTLRAADILEAVPGGWWRLGMTYEETEAFLEKHDSWLVPILPKLRGLMDKPDLFGPGRVQIGNEYSRVIYVRFNADADISINLLPAVYALKQEFEAEECEFHSDTNEFRLWWD